jgi:hypothetical protein
MRHNQTTLVQIEGIMKRTLGSNMLLILALGLVWAGCSPKKQYIYTSRPPAQSVSNAIFDARIEPIKGDNPYFVGFRLAVKNNMSEPLEINWNKSRYLHNGTDKGKLVFRGIKPETVKTGIPNDIIPAQGELMKHISPLVTVGFTPARYSAGPEHPTFVPGALPRGKNSVLLTVEQSGRENQAVMTVRILAKETEK